MKKLFLLSAVLLCMTMFSCGDPGEKKQNDGVVPDTTHGVSAMAQDSLSKEQAAWVYVCPCGGCPEIKESKPGNCTKCGLELVEQKNFCLNWKSCYN